MSDAELGRWVMGAAAWLLLSVAMVASCGCDGCAIDTCGRMCTHGMVKYSADDGCVCAAAAQDGGSK